MGMLHAFATSLIAQAVLDTVLPSARLDCLAGDLALTLPLLDRKPHPVACLHTPRGPIQIAAVCTADGVAYLTDSGGAERVHGPSEHGRRAVLAIAEAHGCLRVLGCLCRHVDDPSYIAADLHAIEQAALTVAYHGAPEADLAALHREPSGQFTALLSLPRPAPEGV